MPSDTRGPSLAWDVVEDTLREISTSEDPMVMTRLVILGEFQGHSGKRLLVVSSDAGGVRLKPWETEGLLVRGLIDSANQHP